MNTTETKLIQRIKSTVAAVAPDADVILYGSYARGEQTDESDIDILILVNKSQVTYEEEKMISYPLYKIESETGQIISPIIFPKDIWESKHYITPFYKNIKVDGILL